MRITNALVTRDTIARLTTNSARLAAAQDRVATGLKVSKMSDDPAAGGSIMATSSSMHAMDQFKRNLTLVGGELDAEDNVLGQVGDILARGRELAAGQAGVNSTTQSRASAAAEVKQLIAQVVQIGNTKLGDTYLFGGTNSATTPPFDDAQTAQTPRYVTIPAGQTAPVTPQGTRAVEVGQGQTMVGVHDGNTIFVQTGVLDALQSLYDGLVADDSTAIGAADASLHTSFDGVQTLVGDLGARRNRVDLIGSSLDAYQQSLTALKSDLSEVDMEQAITEMVARQTAYQAAMMASSKVMGMSLTDYLR